MKTRSILRRLRLPVLSAAALAVLAGPASAQNFSTWVAPGNANWATASSWDALPVSGADTELIFTGGGQSPLPPLPAVFNFATNNIANPFTLTAITHEAAAGNFTITGGALTFVPGTNPVSITTNSQSGRLFFESNVSFTSPTTLTIFGNNGAGAEQWFGGSVVNPVGNTITINTTPPGTLVLITGANNTSFAGTWAQNASTLTQLGAVNAMWRDTRITLTGTCAITAGTTTAAGYGTADTGYNQQLGSVAGTGQFLTGTTISASTVLLGFANLNTTLNGPAGLAGFNIGSHFAKVGTGTLTVSGENGSFNTALSVRDGNLLLSGGLGALVNSLAAPGAFSVYTGGQYRLNNTTAPATGATPMNAQGRISDTSLLRLIGGTLRLDGPSAASPLGSLEQAGTIRPLAGLSTVVVNANAGAPVRFNFLGVNEDAIVRGGQVAFVGTGLGGAPANGVAGITFTTAPTTINGVIPWGLSQAVYAGSTTLALNTFALDSLAVLGPNGVAPLATLADNDFSSATQNVRLNAAIAPAGASSANSLTIETGGTLALGGPLTVTSGAIFSRAATATIGGTGALTATGRLYVSNTGTSTLAITAPIAALSFTKGGTGSVSVGALNLTGTSPIIQVNAGTLNFGGPVTVGGGAPVYQLSRGATISGLSNVTGTLRGGGTVVGPLTMNVGSLIGASSLASDVGGAAGTTGASPGVLTVQGSIAFTGGANSRLRFYLSSVFGGQYTQGLIVANSLDLTAVTPGATLAVQPHSILLSNNDTGNVYDFNAAQNYTWTLVDTTTPIVGFNASAFTVDLTNFTNTVGGSFTVGTADSGNDLVLIYTTAIPEPMVLGLGSLALLGLARLRRKA